MVWRKPAHTSPGAGAGCGPFQTLFHMPWAKHTGPLFCSLSWVCSSHPPLLGRMPPAVQKRSMAERPLILVQGVTKSSPLEKGEGCLAGPAGRARDSFLGL